MRARRPATDIVILVVAADDGVMPQTQKPSTTPRGERADHRGRQQDRKPEADPDRVKRELANLDSSPRTGAQTIFVPTSAKKVRYRATAGDDRAAVRDPRAQGESEPRAKGVIIESRWTAAAGPWPPRIQNGTLKEGDAIVVARTPAASAR